MGGEPLEFSWAGEVARHVGTVAHGWLQRIAEDGLHGWDAARVDALEQALRRQLAALGVAEGGLKEAAQRVAQALRDALSDERGRWLLGPQREARNEYRMSTCREGVLRHLVIDRTFVDAQGRRWIVDYKTSPHLGGDREAFLDRERDRYRAQLEAYAAAFAPGTPLCFGLYFPLLGGWREWVQG